MGRSWPTNATKTANDSNRCIHASHFSPIFTLGITCAGEGGLLDAEMDWGLRDERHCYSASSGRHSLHAMYIGLHDGSPHDVCYPVADVDNNTRESSSPSSSLLSSPSTGVGDGGQGGMCPLKFGKNIFRAIIMKNRALSGKYHKI